MVFIGEVKLCVKDSYVQVFNYIKPIFGLFVHFRFDCVFPNKPNFTNGGTFPNVNMEHQFSCFCKPLAILFFYLQGLSVSAYVHVLRLSELCASLVYNKHRDDTTNTLNETVTHI